MTAGRVTKEVKKDLTQHDAQFENNHDEIEAPVLSSGDYVSIPRLQSLIGNQAVQRLIAQGGRIHENLVLKPHRFNGLPPVRGVAAQREPSTEREEEGEEEGEQPETEGAELADLPFAPPDGNEDTPPETNSLRHASIQRDEDSGNESASDLIDKHTSWLISLDEEGLGRDLANRLPGQSSLVKDVLNELGSGDRDDVSYEITIASRGSLGSIPEDLRIRFIEEMVGGVVTDDEEGAIADIWISFEPSLAEVAEGKRDLWKKSLWESDQLVDYVGPIVSAFADDVRGLARAYLAENKRVLVTEGLRYGIDLENQQSFEVDPHYLEAVRAMVPGVIKLRKQLDDLKEIKVGYHPVSDCLIGDCKSPTRFNPQYAPSMPPDGDEDPPWPTWEQVKAQYDRVSAVISGFANMYPTIYLLIQQDKLEELDKAKDSSQALKVVFETIQKANEKIKEADNKIITGDISHYDLKMIQTQLFSGSSQAAYDTQYPWNKPYYQDIANDDLKGHEAREFWTNLGLSLAAAAALIAAPFTGGATAAFLVGFGVGIGAAQAGISWEKYLDMSAMGDAEVREELTLVSEGEVSAALITAIIDTVAVFLDAYGGRAATASARASREALEAAERGVKEQMARELRERMIREAGKEGAMTLGGTGLAVGMHELGDEETLPKFEGSVGHVQVGLGTDEDESSSSSVSRMVIQRTPAPIMLTGAEFEGSVEKALLKGPLGDLPQMSFVIPGQYTGSGWGIDRIGIVFDEASGAVDLYHLEMKWVSEPVPGGPPAHVPGLGTPSAGTQTGKAWTENAVDGFLNSSHPKARAGKERLRRALQKMYPGEFIDIERMRTFLRGKLVNAPVRVITPPWADLSRLYKQVAALVRWGREARILTHLPK